MPSKNPVETKTLFVGLLVGLAHVVSGLAVLVTPVAVSVTPLAAFHWMMHFFGAPQLMAGGILLAAGFMAVLGANQGVGASRNSRAVLFLPQQILLMCQLITIAWALLVGEYPDGYVPRGGAWFILADQIWAWILAVSHSIWLAAFVYGGTGVGRDGVH